VTVVILGLAQLIGVASIAVMAVFVVSAPGARAAVAALLAKRRRPQPASRVESPGDQVALAPVAVLELDEAFVVHDVMTDEDLCQAWRSSYVALGRATTVSSLLRVVEMRALYLDELERRAGPAALQPPPAPSNPLPPIPHSGITGHSQRSSGRRATCPTSRSAAGKLPAMPGPGGGSPRGRARRGRMRAAAPRDRGWG
jgi:hypothetical protein